MRIAVGVAASIAAMQPALAQQAPPLAPSETLLQVEATGTAAAVPDVATLSATVATDAGDPRTALANNAAAANRIIAALRVAGVDAGSIRTDDLRVSPRHRKDKDGDDIDEVIGARAVNRMKVKLSRVGDAGRVFDALTQAGATEISGPEFDFRDDGAVRRAARTAAVGRAQAQAADYAAAFGLHVARVLRISERSARVDSGNDIVVTGSRVGTALPPVEPGEREVTVTVWVDYALTR